VNGTPGIDSARLGIKIPGSLKMFTNTGSGYIGLAESIPELL